PRPLRDRQRGGVGKTVVRADHEGRERVARIEKGAGFAPLLPGSLLPRSRGGWSAHPRGRARAGRCRRTARGGDESHVDGAAEQVLKRGAHLRTELAFEPLARKSVRHADKE